MQAHIKFVIAIAAVASAGLAAAQTTTDSARDAGRTARETTRDAASAVGRAASAAVTPGDQNLGRNPDNRSGGLMGSERSGTDATAPASRRAARADRG